MSDDYVPSSDGEENDITLEGSSSVADAMKEALMMMNFESRDESDYSDEEEDRDPDYTPGTGSDESDFEPDAPKPTGPSSSDNGPSPESKLPSEPDEHSFTEDGADSLLKTYQSPTNMSDEDTLPPLCHRNLESDQVISDPDYPDIYVKAYCPTKFTKMGKMKKSSRPYDTPHACRYCGQLMTNIQDHLENKHGEQPEVMEIQKTRLVGWLSGGFTPCRHLRPSSGREHTIVTYSVR